MLMVILVIARPAVAGNAVVFILSESELMLALA
jgi:hypothetical protein